MFDKIANIFKKNKQKDNSKYIEIKREEKILDNRQEIFNIICERALQLNSKITDYRTENGPCLVGVLINDEHYEAHMENISVRSSVVFNALILSGLKDPEENYDFVVRIQEANDFAEGTEGIGYQRNLFEELEKISWDFEVKIPDFYVRP